MNPALQSEIQKRIESFAADITAVLQRAVADAVGDALKSAPAASRAPVAGRGRRTSLSAAELYAELLKNGNRNIEGIAKGLGCPTTLVAPVLRTLVEEGRVRRAGKARGTRYSAVAGKGPAAAAAGGTPQKASKKSPAKVAKKATAKAAKKPAAKKPAAKKPAAKKPAAKKPAEASVEKADKPAEASVEKVEKADKPAEA